MPSRPLRLTQRIKRLRYFVPAIALAALAAFIDHPLALVPLLLAQPLFLAGAVSCLGYLLDADFGTLTLRRAPVALVFFVAYALVVAGLVGAPAAMLAASASPLGAALLSLGVVLSVVVLWRSWAAFGFAFLWDDAYPESTAGSWILTAVRRVAIFSHHAAAARDPWFGHGNLAALALALVTAGALALVGLAPLLDAEIRTALGLGYALLVAPLAHLVIAWRSEWLLIEEPAAAPAEAEPLPAVDPAELAPSANDPVRRDADFRRAVAENRIDTALVLLAAGASVNPPADPRDADQRSVVAIAATLPDLRLLRALILKGADLNTAVAGLTPLLAATRDSYSGRPDAVMTLLTNGARAQQADVDGNTPLHGAALTREATIAAMLVDAGADPNAVNRDGLTPLGVAAGAGNEVLVRFLLEHGARPDAARAQPALIAACSGTDDTPALVKLLLKHKAPLDARDRLGRGALHAAALHGHAAMAEALLAAGAAVDARDANGVTPLMEAARAGANRVLQRLVFRKPDVAAVDQAGRNALMLACLSRNANEETVRTLLALAPDVRSATPDGRRAVDFAVAAGRWPLVRLIDPSYELPAALTDDDAAPDDAPAVDADGEPLDRPALLLRALRLGRTDMAAELLALTPPLREPELLPLAHACLALDAAEPLHWLLRHGVSVDARDGIGQPLLAHALGLRPLPRAAIAVLRAAAAPVGGSGLLVPLVDAADDGEADLEALVCGLVAAGACTGGRDRHGRSLLQAAVRLGWTRFVHELVERGADPNAADPRGRTPMHELAQLPDATACALADRLLAAGGDPERTGCDGQTPLGAALATGRTGLIARLSWAGGFRHPGRRLRPGDLPAAAACGDLTAIERLLGLGLALDGRDPQGCSALLRASGGGHLAVVDSLLARGADATLAAHTGATPLSAAISARRDAVVERLLAAGVDPDQRLAGGATALLVAAALGNDAAIDQLLRRRADPAARDDTDGNALHAAAQFAFASADGERAQRVFDALIAAGTPTDARNRNGQTPLLLLLGARVQPGTPCAQRQLPQLVRVLVAAGADVGAADERGVGVLHACAMHGLIDAASELKRAGADLDQRDRLGRSAHDVALMLGYVDVAASLRRGPPTRAADPRAGRG
jgi:ankyrin repeat protein